MTEEEQAQNAKVDTKNCKKVKIQDIIPITRHEVHTFSQELCDETLF